MGKGYKQATRSTGNLLNNLGATEREIKTKMKCHLSCLRLPEIKQLYYLVQKCKKGLMHGQ